MPLVADHMTKSLLSIDADATLGEAAARMAERGVGAVVVLEGEGVAAILTERDVMKCSRRGRRTAGAAATEWMTRHPDRDRGPVTRPTTPHR